MPKTKKTQKLPNPRHDHWCLSTLIKRGWTPELIAKLLPPPRLAKNSHGGSSAMKEWPKDYVLYCEQKLIFQRECKRPNGFSGEPLINGQF